MALLNIPTPSLIIWTHPTPFVILTITPIADILNTALFRLLVKASRPLSLASAPPFLFGRGYVYAQVQWDKV